MVESLAIERGRERIAFQEIVRLQSPDSGQYVALPARDLSKGGIFINSLKPLPVGSRFSLEFLLHRRNVRIERAEVVWTTANKSEPFARQGMGCKFLDMPRESERYLDEILDRFLESGHPRAAPHFDRSADKLGQDGPQRRGREPNARSGKMGPPGRNDPGLGRSAPAPRPATSSLVKRMRETTKDRFRALARATRQSSRRPWLLLLLFLAAGLLSACLFALRT